MLFNLLAETPKLDTASIVILIACTVLFIGYFIWQIISNKKRQKEAQDKVNSLKVGDRVKTIGGICGFVAEINDDENTFVLETGTASKKSYVKFDKGAIYQTAPAEGSAVAEKAEVKTAVEEKAKEEKAPAKATKKAKKEEK